MARRTFMIFILVMLSGVLACTAFSPDEALPTTMPTFPPRPTFTPRPSDTPTREPTRELPDTPTAFPTRDPQQSTSSGEESESASDEEETDPGDDDVIVFEVEPEFATGGQTVTLTWEIAGVEQVTILWSHDLMRFDSDTIPNSEPPQPPAGSVQVTLPDGVSRVQFFIQEPEGLARSIDVSVECPNRHIAETAKTDCPSAAEVTTAVSYQPFQGGFMVYFKGNIFALYDGGSGRVFADYWNGEEITFEGNPPEEGLTLPMRGFGRVWIDNADVQGKLGWATGSEEPYQMELQEGGEAAEGQSYWFTVPDGRLLEVTRLPGDDAVWSEVRRQ